MPAGYGGTVVLDAAWLWVPDSPVDPAPIVRFAQARRLHEVFVSVPWPGPSDATTAICIRLARVGIRVSALGGAIDWAAQPERARTWAERAHAGGLFAATHLDIEPWAATDWPANADVRLAGVAAAVRQVKAATRRPVEVDLAPFLADTHPLGFGEIAAAADHVVLMSYRNTTPAILSFSEAARTRLRAARTAYRLGVETRPSPHPHTTFAGKPESVMTRVADEVSRVAAGDPWFSGIAVHDLAGWEALPAGT